MFKLVTQWPPKCGDIGFDCANGGITDLIVLGEIWGDAAVLGALKDSGYPIPHHAYTVTNDGRAFESLNEGPTFTPINDYRQMWIDGQTWLMRPEGSDAAKMAAMALTIQKYDPRPYGWFKTLLGFLVVFPFRRILRRNVPNPFHLGIMCSELAGYYLKALHFFLRSYGETGASDQLWFARYANASWDPAYLAALCLTNGVVSLAKPAPAQAVTP